MLTQVKKFGKFILMAVILSVVFASCDRDKDVAVNSPAYKISQSEGLEIPAVLRLPSNLPKGNLRAVTFYAEGVQKYKAQIKAGSNPVTYEWVFVAPQAILYNSDNAIVGTHSAGPTWQLINSTTDSIYAQQYAPAKTAPSPDGTSIDWLLLMPKAGKVPTGIFADVSYIQRIATSGGKAPSTTPTSESQVVEVPYTAIYRFSRKKP